MTQALLDWLRGLIAAGDVHPFYVSGPWRKLSAKVLRDDHWDCQLCKQRGKRVAADLVHHQKHVKLFPELALSRFYVDESGEKRRNLISVCRCCHENVCHPERMRKRAAKAPAFTTEERWD